MLETIDAEKTIKCLTDKIAAKSASIADYSRIIQFDFTDAHLVYRITIENGRVKRVEKTSARQEAAVTVACKVETLQAILDNKMGATRALITRKVIVDGPIMIIRELRQKVLGAEHNNLA